MDENNTNKNKTPIFIYAVLIAAVVFLIGYASYEIFLPALRNAQIKKTLENTYANCEFTEIESDLKPKKAGYLKKMFVTYDESRLNKNYYYYFSGTDSNGESFSGYTTVFGKVIADNYANIRYSAEKIEMFESITDIKAEYPDLFYLIQPDYSVERNRYMYTDDCKTFEGYKNARFFAIVSFYGVFDGLQVGFEEPDSEIIEELNSKLKEANFDSRIEYGKIKYDNFQGKDVWYTVDPSQHYYPKDVNAYDMAPLFEENAN